MTKTIWTATCSVIVGAATIAVMAQTPPPQQNSSTSSDRRITVTGCLKAAPSAADEATTAGTAGTAGTTGSTGTTGAAGAAGAARDSADAKFVLTDAKISPAAGETGAAGSTAGSTAAQSESSSAQSAQTYRLVANPASLSPHVGKKLELTGTLVDQPGSAPSASGAEASAATNAPALRVEAGKVIAASCQE